MRADAKVPLLGLVQACDGQTFAFFGMFGEDPVNLKLQVLRGKLRNPLSLLIIPLPSLAALILA